MSEVIRIIAAVVDTSRLTLYLQDGTNMVIPQGDPRIRPLVDKVIPAIEANGFCDLETDDLSTSNHYSVLQESLGGMVQFFRMFKDQLDTMLTKLSVTQAPAVVEACAVGSVPGEYNVTPAQSPTQTAVSEIMQHAIPASAPEFHTQDEDTTTIVAVTEEGAIIPGIEKIDKQLQAVALKLGSVEGVKNFFRRVSSVERAHSIQDLLTFMERGELPLADDGSILVYKRLNRSSDEGVFVDCHSGNVRQRVGSKVFMNEKLVDANRHTDCSNGLHVARRDYLSSFSGNVCVLAKLAPEDVIAVPHRDARKLRAKAYHIIAQLSRADANAVCSDRPMTDTVLLGNAVAGNHIGIVETVEITQGYGGGLIVTPEETEQDPVQLDEATTATSLDEMEILAETSEVDAAQVARESIGRKTGRQQKAEELLQELRLVKSLKGRQVAAQQLVDFKRSSKSSWDTLGIARDIATGIEELAKGNDADLNPPQEKKEFITAGTPRERIRMLINQGIKANITEILTVKRMAKKGWAALGVSHDEEKQILRAAP